MGTPILFADGALEAVPRLLQAAGARHVLVVAGPRSYAASGAETWLEGLLRPFTVHRFSGFTTTPKLRDVLTGVELQRALACDAVLGVGGGTALDIAKLVATLAPQPGAPQDYIVGGARLVVPRRCLLVLVPTTAGTGSEVTSFGVAYVDGVKRSLDHPFVLPDHAIIDPRLTWSMPPRLTATTGVDALSQAIESYWCVNSTTESRRYAAASLRLGLANLERACHEPTPEVRHNMSLAALLAGASINISRTTAPHAVSYPLTGLFGIPHGHACGLTLPAFLLYNYDVSRDDVLDRRGVTFVRERLDEVLGLLGVKTPEAGLERIARVIRNVGLEDRLSQLGITATAVPAIVASAFDPARVRNNPRRLTAQGLAGILTAIL